MGELIHWKNTDRATLEVAGVYAPVDQVACSNEAPGLNNPIRVIAGPRAVAPPAIARATISVVQLLWLRSRLRYCTASARCFAASDSA